MPPKVNELKKIIYMTQGSGLELFYNLHLCLSEKETLENFIGRLKKNSRGFVVTSFSRMQQEREKEKQET